MRRSVLIISSSPRKGGNSDILADEFGRGAREAGAMVEKETVRGKRILFCKGCMACQKTQRCVIRDDAEAIVQKMRHADIVVFATPVYFYAMCGQMKTMLDRTFPLYASEYAFRDVYLLATATEKEETALDGAVSGLQGWVACFDAVELKGVLRGVGVSAPGDVRGVPEMLQAAYEMGKSI